jgi:uncharacterized protein YlzI (FlbEa/FlbD family)
MSTTLSLETGVGPMNVLRERNDNYINATKEMIRADHLLYVSLKYSRTVDVILSVVNRLVESYRFAIIAAVETHYTDEAVLKKHMHGNATLIKAMLAAYPDSEKLIKQYKYLRKLNKSEVTQRLNEFRRHVTLVTEIEGNEVRVKIEDLTEYYEEAKDFLRYINSKIHDNGTDDLLSHKN